MSPLRRKGQRGKERRETVEEAREQRKKERSKLTYYQQPQGRR